MTLWYYWLTNSTIQIKIHVEQTFCSLLQVYYHHWKIMSYNVAKKMTLPH